MWASWVDIATVVLWRLSEASDSYSYRVRGCWYATGSYSTENPLWLCKCSVVNAVKVSRKVHESFLDFPWYTCGALSGFQLLFHETTKCSNIICSVIPWKIHWHSQWVFHEFLPIWISHGDSMKWFHEFSMENPWRIYTGKTIWIFHGFSMENSWIYFMRFPWDFSMRVGIFCCTLSC